MPKVKKDRDGLPVPNSELSPEGKKYQYLGLPKKMLENMESAYFDLKLVEVGETDTGKYFFKFEILDTDTRMTGEASILLDPNQEFADTYFWKALFGMVAALRGKEPTAELFEEMREKYKKVLQRALDGKYCDKTCKLTLEPYENKKGNTSVKQIWSVLE